MTPIGQFLVNRLTVVSRHGYRTSLVSGLIFSWGPYRAYPVFFIWSISHFWLLNSVLYFPLKFASRFSIMAAMASLESSEVMQMPWH